MSQIQNDSIHDFAMIRCHETALKIAEILGTNSAESVLGDGTNPNKHKQFVHTFVRDYLFAKAIVEKDIEEIRMDVKCRMDKLDP